MFATNASRQMPYWLPARSAFQDGLAAFPAGPFLLLGRSCGSDRSRAEKVSSARRCTGCGCLTCLQVAESSSDGLEATVSFAWGRAGTITADGFQLAFLANSEKPTKPPGGSYPETASEYSAETTPAFAYQMSS